MSSKRYHMSDDESDSSKSTGWRIQPCTGFVFCFLAIAVAVGVGLIVHFVEKVPEVECVCAAPTGSSLMHGVTSAYSYAQCVEKAKDPLSGICKPCNTSEAQKGSYRLPQTLRPLHYDIEMKPNMYEGDPSTFTFNGNVIVTFECMHATRDVIMHAKDMDINSVSVKSLNDSIDEPAYVSHEMDSEREIVLIHLSQQLKPGLLYSVEMKTSGPLTNDLEGFYLSSYTRGNKTTYLAVTQFESNDARLAFPCFDEPGLKARFDVTLVRRQDFTSVSNMKIKHSEPREGEFVADVYQTTPIMSTYLVAFVVSDFTYITGNTTHGLEYRVWAEKALMGQLEYGLSVGTRAIAHFETYFDIPFPLPKQDMLAIPDFGPGAMENWGCITYRAETLLVEPGVTSDRAQRIVLIDIVHELAHQWFGDLVTMAWWDDLWLNEGFATFFSYLEAEHVEPGWDLYNEFVMEEVLPVFESDGHVTSHPIYSTTLTSQIFDGISYNKAGSILRMLRFFVGEETFRNGISRYLKSRAFGNAVHGDLWNALHEQSLEDSKSADVVETMKTWTSQMNYPVVHVSRADTNTLRLRQTRFLFDDENDDPGTFTSDYGYKWNIPFTFTTSHNPTYNVTDDDIVWMKHDDKQDTYTTDTVIPDPSDGGWIVGNINHHGFYRVNYDKSIWKNINRQLKRDHTVIIPINRAQIINDAIDMSRADMLDLRVALGSLEYLSSELSYYPWKTAMTKLEYIDKMLRDTDIYGAFKNFVRTSVSKAFKHYGLQGESTSHIETFAREQVVSAACRYAHPECLREARDTFLAWKRNPPVRNIHPELLRTVLCAGVAEGDAEDWAFLLDRFRQEESVAVKDDMMLALACSRERWIMEEFLRSAITPSIIRRGQATRALGYGPAFNPGLQPLLWDFLRENYDLLLNQFEISSKYFRMTIIAATDTFNTEFQLQQLESFINSTNDLGIGKDAFKETVSVTKANIKWMQEKYPIVKQWLADLGYYENMNGKKEEVPQTRIFLPKNIKPVHYDLEIKPYIYDGPPQNFSFEGKVRITFDCIETTPEIVLHARKLDIDQTSVLVMSVSASDERNTDDSDTKSSKNADKDLRSSSDTATDKFADVLLVKHSMSGNFLTITLSRNLTAGERYSLQMDYNGPLKDDLAGLYLSSYKEGGVTKYLAVTQFESEDARKAFPSFDEPAMKATFNMTIVRRSDFSSTSNMPIVHSQPRDGGFIADIYQTTPVMSTYLVAAMVSQFTYITGNTSRGLPFRVWARKESHDELQYALDVGTKCISFYEDYFDIDFPLPKQDMVALPDFAMGAMENWGMITYREQRLFYKEGVTNNNAKQSVTVATTHELAHQWFGDLLTPKWWDDLWLNEGFATFVEYMGANTVEPSFKMFDQFIINEMLPVFSVDGLTTSHPVYVDVKTVDEINEIFDAISYNKGGTVLRMLRFFIGEETFRKGLTRYLNEHKYSNADHTDLWAALDKQAAVEGKSVDVGDTMKTWTLQMNYPMVTVRRQGARQLVLSQERFLFGSDSADPGTYISPYGYKWNIPFTFTTSDERSFTKTDADIIWMSRHNDTGVYESQIDIPESGDSWVLGNVGLTGLYRVQYKMDNWRALIHQLNTDHTAISNINRAQIINDAWDLANSGRLDQSVAGKTVEYMSGELDFFPWTAALDKLSYVSSMLQNTQTYGQFQKFMRKISSSPFQKLGVNDTGASQLESFTRREVLGAACEAGNTECKRQAGELFKQWRHSAHTIYPELRKNILCIGVSGGDPDDWEYVFDQYQNEAEVSVKDDLLMSLACTQEEWLIHTLLQRAITPSAISRQDSTRVIHALTNSARGQPIVWNFIKQNWPLLRDEFSDTFNYVVKMITGATRAFNTQSQLQEIEDFVRATPELGVGERAFHQAIEQSKANVRWMQDNYPAVRDWLHAMTL